MRAFRHAAIGRLLVGMLLGAIAVAPAFADHTPGHTKAQVKKLSKRVNKARTALEADLARAFTRFGPITVGAGLRATVLTSPPFTLTGECEVDGSELDADLIISTTEEGSAFGGNNKDLGSFGPTTPESERRVWSANPTTGSIGPPRHSFGYDDQINGVSPSGRAINATVSAFSHKDAGTCTYYGQVTTVA